MVKETEEDKQFITASREEKKLEIALKRYFELTEQEEILKLRYQTYLLRRFRPAVHQLIARKENRKLELLLQENPVEPAVLDAFLNMAFSCKNQEAQILLLRQKEKQKGFRAKNWEL